MTSQSPDGRGSSIELGNITARLMLAKSFTPAELEYLQLNPQFQHSVAEMHTFDTYEATTALADRLLRERGSPIPKRLPPPLPPGRPSA